MEEKSSIPLFSLLEGITIHPSNHRENEMDKDDEILLQAAKAAKAMLPALEAEQKRLTDEIQKVAIRIGRYQAIVAGVDLSEPVATEAPTKKASKGSCMPDIDESLEKQAMTAKDLQADIKKRTGIEYGVSTLYANLQRGQKTGKYVNDNGRWSKP